MAGTELGEYYTVPVILSFEGIDKQVNTKLGKVFGTAGKKAGGDFAKGAGDGIKSLEDEVNSAAKAYEKLRDKASDAAGKIRVEEEKLAKVRQSGKSDQIAVAEERLSKARRDGARITREAGDSHTVLLSSQKKLADQSGDLGGKMGSLTAVAGRMGTAVAGAGLAAGAAAAGGVALLAAGAVKATRELYDLGAQFDDLSDTLQVKTGLSGAALDQLKTSVERLGNTNVPSTFAEIGDVAAEVTRNLHLSGPEFDAVTSRLANLARMGQSVDVRTLGKVFRGFGVEAKDQAGALNSLYEASTKTGLSIDDLTGTLAKGGAPLRQFNLGFGESAALMTSLEDAGLDGEKGVLALNKAFAYFSKEGIPAQEGLRKTITEIQRLGDTPEGAALANKVFGAKGGAQFFEAIRRGDVDLRSLSTSLSSTGLDINKVSDDTADWSERWQELKNKTSTALEPLASGTFDGINGGLDKLADWVDTHHDEVIDFFIKLGDVTITVFDWIQGEIAGTLKTFGDLVDAFHDIDTLVGNLTSWLPGYDQEKADKFNDTLAHLRDNLYDASTTTENGRGAWDELRKQWDDLGEKAKKADDNVGPLGDSVGKLGLEVKKLPPTLPSWMNDLATGGGGTPGGPQNPLLVPLGPAAPGTPGGGPLIPGITPGGGGRGGLMNLQLSQLPQQNWLTGSGGGGGSPRKVGSDNGLLQSTISAKDSIAGAFANINDIGGWRPEDGFNEHSSGQAIDVMVPGWNTPAGKSEGDQIAAFALKNPAVDYVLWQQTQWNSDGTSKPMSDRGSPTQNHMDHVHVHTRKGGSSGTSGEPGQGQTTALSGSTTSLPGGTNTSPGGLAGSLFQDANGQWRSSLPGWDHLIQRESSGVNQKQGITDVNSGGNEAEGLFQITPQTWAEHGGTQYAPSALSATPQQQADIAARIFGANPSGSDWGAGLSGRENPAQLLAELQGSGGGSSGLVNAFGAGYQPGIGSPGYNEYGEPGYYETDPRRIAQANRGVEDSRRRIADADQAVIDAQTRRDELDALASEDDRKKADRQIEEARLDAKRSREDAQWAQQDLEEAQKGDFKQAKEAKKTPGSKGGNSATDVSGVGGILSSFLTETFGLDGTLFPDIGNLMPVKMAGTLLGALMPQQQSDETGMITTGGGAFGMPNITAPPMPADGVHGGSGALPGPPPNVTVNAGNTFNGQVGLSPQDIEKQRQASVARAIPRIPVGN